MCTHCVNLAAHLFILVRAKGERVNDHFKPSNLKVNNPKTGKIKHYGNQVKREILCYFDDEQKAYEYEEWLISAYGLESEGGILTNYAKNRFEYSDRFVEDVANKGGKSRFYPPLPYIRRLKSVVLRQRRIKICLTETL